MQIIKSLPHFMGVTREGYYGRWLWVQWHRWHGYAYSSFVDGERVITLGWFTFNWGVDFDKEG